MTRVTKGLCIYKTSHPKGLSAPVPRLYICIKTWKILYKIRLQRYFFETCNKWAKWQGFSVDIRILSTKSCLPPPQGYIHVEKCLKNGYEVIRALCWHKKFVPKGFSALAPRLYTCIKWLKMCIKSDFKEIILKLATYGQRERNFCCYQNFVPNGLSPPPGAIYIWWNMKKMYIKSDCKAIFLNMQQMGKVIRASCWHQKFVPKDCVPWPRGYIHI